jgi:hypothetical protein
MHLLDPYGLGASTPDKPAENADQPIAVPERQAEVELARGIPEEEHQPASENLSASGLDPAMRLQDGVGTWIDGGDTTPDEVGSADSPEPGEPAPEPYVPLTDSGGQGI